MRNFVLLRNSVMALALTVGFVSCSDDEEDPIDYDYVLDVASADIQYNAQNYWEKTYEGETLTIGGFAYSHTGSMSPYQAWSGFTASKSTDNADDVASDNEASWLTYQWAAMPQGGVAGKGTPCLIAYWDSYTETATGEPSVKISQVDGLSFRPESVCLTNNACAFWSMTKGDGFAHAFTADDEFAVLIHGVKNGVETGVVTAVLADGTDILRTWKNVDLSALGTVDNIYFTVTSTDEGEWGINTPTYFALDRLVVNMD